QTEHAPQEALPDIAELLGVGAARLRQEFSASILLWRFYRERYQQFYHHENFSHYFWSLRSMYTTLLGLLHIAEKVPQAHCIHSVSTGYAGALASFLRIVRRKPLVLTEHGIYTKERKIDIYSAPWGVEEQAVLPPGLNDRLSIQRRMWIRFFEDLGRLTYSASSVILTLYQANQQKQLDLGAPPERCLVVPNGVDLTRFSFLRKQRREGVPGVIALIGRVVRIKDIKNFIRTVGCLVDKIPGVQGWIVGPEDEDPEYVAECKALVVELGLQQQVYFLGFRKIEDILPKIGLLTLTSISEGQPLVVLEGFAAGIPAVTTDVGSCRELIEGRSHKDRKLGKAGAVVPIANPQAMALAAEKFLTDETAWLRAQEAAIARVESIYCESHLLNRYQRLYNKAISYGRNRV
ncbi:MAG: GT4 family glycosyltransferase PelF, partial [Thiolinea sp.]